MPLKLIVTNVFASYQIGDEITDAALVKQYAETHAADIVKVEVRDEKPAQNEQGN